MHGKLWSLFSFLFACLCPALSYAQNYRIEIDLPAYRDSQIIVAGYYFGGLFVKDSLQLDHRGRAIFQGNEPLQQGIYQLYIHKNKQYDFLVGTDQHFSIQLPAGATTIELEAATESEKFQLYIDYLGGQKARFANLSAQLEKLKLNPDSLSILKKQLQQLDEEVRNYRFEVGQKERHNLFGTVLLAGHQQKLEQTQIPSDCQRNDSLKWVYEYNYRKNHYWDYFDLGDRRLWHTPFVKERLSEYFNKVLLQTPDSVLPEAIRMIEKYRTSPETFQNLTSFILNNSIQSKVMGLENVFVALAERYYLSGQASWADRKTLENIRREVALRKHNLIGNEAPELLLEDEDGEFHSLKQSPTPYTILAFWEPSCSHCKHEIPKLYDELFLAAKPSLLSVYAVYTMTDKKEWTDFISEYELGGWMNLWDPKQISDMKLLYGVRTTPSLFLLDENKKIVAKQLDVEGMTRLLETLNVIQ
ncbi:redoxin domain-containing protein [Mangrovibacterium sp.]|uniref:redoxin domain-containing protein n=1 Tax=Mangrovibacterium sp. TaxID=1961364 RepID=UPI0035697DC4